MSGERPLAMRLYDILRWLQWRQTATSEQGQIYNQEAISMHEQAAKEHQQAAKQHGQAADRATNRFFHRFNHSELRKRIFDLCTNDCACLY